MNNKGVSVIALVITIIVLILITSITIYNGMNVLDKSRNKNASDRLSTIATSIVAHEEELGFKETVIGGSFGNYDTYFDNDTADVYTDDKLYRESDDQFSDLTDSAFSQIGPNEYTIMGLSDFATAQDFPPVYLVKAPNYNNKEEKIYLLKTPKMINKSGVYDEDDFVYYRYTTYSQEVKDNYKMEFDSVKGVNRPLLTKNMIPVKNYFAGNDYDRFNPAFVDDVYKDDWYNYSKESPMWANVMMKNTQDSYSIANRYYVWIPRFAYKIQDFYKGVDYSDIPSSAIDIVFLREDTDYMGNDEVIPTGYQVHPAFKYKDTVYGEESGDFEVNIPGFWVAKDYIATCDGVYSASSGKTAVELVDINYIHPGQFDAEEISDGTVQSRMLKNTEWAAIAYLSMYTVGRTTNGNSLKDNPSGVIGLNADVGTVVAGGWEDSDMISHIPYMDRYVLTGDRISYYSYEMDPDKLANREALDLKEHNCNEKKMGDAMIITSTGSGDRSSWFGGYSEKITPDKPIILRGDEDGNLFSYRAISNRGSIPAVRNVLVIRGK